MARYRAAPRPRLSGALPAPPPTPRHRGGLTIERADYRAGALDISAVSRALLADTITSAVDEADAVMGALDIILHGYPVGLPL